MSKGKSTKITFKKYDQNQGLLLPPSLDEMIPENHLVRVLNGLIEKIDIDLLLKSYKGGGTSIYHPKMMIKVIVYAYLNKIYTSRKIAKALREDIHFMWLSGMQYPDFRTINSFRSSRLKEVIDQVFASQVEFFLQQGYVKLENYFIDGTKIEANANRTSYVWSKNVKRYAGSTSKNISDLLKHIYQINNDEDIEYGDKDLEELGEGVNISSESVEEHLKKIREKLTDKKSMGALEQDDKDVEKLANKIEKEHLPKLKKYEQQNKDLAGRNSFSKTDKDASFIRMKNDLLRPGYNVMIGCENQFILNYSIHQNSGDSGLLIPHIEKLDQLTGRMPINVIGDAAFGSEQNYDFIYKNNIGNYLKYNMFDLEQAGSYSTKTFTRLDFTYNSQDDTFICPNGETLTYKQTTRQISENGYTHKVREYQCMNCENCKFADKCKKKTGNKILLYNPTMEAFRKQARENLTSSIGEKLRKQRSTEPETVFADIKWNQRFTKFNLRGKDKVNVEWGLLSLVHNFKKYIALYHQFDQVNQMICQKSTLSQTFFAFNSNCTTKINFCGFF